MNLRIFPLALLLQITSVASVIAQRNEQAILLKTATGDLHGTLLIPENKQPLPVVLIIAGSGATDRNGNAPGMNADIYRALADSLSANGIASLRYDKRGVGESTPAMRSESELTFDVSIADAAGWIGSLKSDPRFSTVTVLGHSEGSLIGMIAAKTAHADGYISVSGAGQRIDRIIIKQLREAAPQFAEQASILLDSLSKGYTVHEPGGPLNSLFRSSVQPYVISWLKRDPQEEIKKITIPILILQGTTDIQVSVDEARMLKAAKPEATLVLIDSMNHILRQAPADRQANILTYNVPSLPLKPQLVSAIDVFVFHRVKRTRPA